MPFTESYLDYIRSGIAPHDAVLSEARERLRVVRAAAFGYPGSLRTYASGSIPQFTANHPISDADGGLVLDRRCYPDLGPDGAGQAPQDVVDDLGAVVGAKVRDVYPRAVARKSKRGPKLFFGAPIDGQDPTVDLVLALTRRDGDGLWIPNLETNTWEPSHPEKHVELVNTGTASLLRTRRRVVRLAKAWNKQYTEPAFSSHNLSMLALDCVLGGQNLADALADFFAYSAKSIADGDSPDPAAVSKPIRVLVDRDDAVRRLQSAAAGLRDALDHDEDEHRVRKALSGVYWKYLTPPAPDPLRATIDALRRGVPTTTSLGLAGPAVALRPTRAYGGPR